MAKKCSNTSFLWLLMVLLIVCTGLCRVSNAFADNKEEVIVVSEIVGEVIDADEREKFQLFEAYKGFKSAVFLRLADGNTVIEITYEEEGIEKITRLPQSEDSIKSVGDYINHYDEVKDKFYEADSSLIIKGTLRIPDSNNVQILTTKDGSKLIGRIVEIEKDEIQFESKLGKLAIPIMEIREIKEVSVSLFKEGQYWFPNPNSTRLYFAPTGRCLKKGEGYFADYYLFFTMIAVGVTNNITLSGGMSILPTGDFVENNIFYFTPKIGLIQRDNGALSVGAMMVKLPSFGDSAASSVGILYSVGTLGGQDRSITAGLGYGYVDWDFADKPMLMIGGESRVSRRVALVTENWMMPGVDQPLISYGMRFFGEALSVDFAFINTLGDGMFFPGIPYIDFVFKF